MKAEIVSGTRDITPMSAEVRLRRFEARKLASDRQLQVLRDIAVELIRQPATGMLLGVIATEGAAKVNLINQTERAAINAVLISAGLLQAFKPVTIGTANG